MDYWLIVSFIAGLIIGLVPYIFTVTPLCSLIKPISISPTKINIHTGFDTIGYFSVRNNRNIPLYQVGILVRLPRGLSTQDVTIDKLTSTDDYKGLPIDMSFFGIVMRDDKGYELCDYKIDKILPGESNMLSFSIRVQNTRVSEPVVLSCGRYSKVPGEVIGRTLQ